MAQRGRCICTLLLASLSVKCDKSPAAYIYFSVMTAITPGYGRFDLKPDMCIAASIEVVFGAFIWVALTAILSRKYFRS